MHSQVGHLVFRIHFERFYDRNSNPLLQLSNKNCDILYAAVIIESVLSIFQGFPKPANIFRIFGVIAEFVIPKHVLSIHVQDISGLSLPNFFPLVKDDLGTLTFILFINTATWRKSG